MTAMLLQFAPAEVRRSKKRAATYASTHASLIGFVQAQKKHRDEAVIDAVMVELGDVFEAAVVSDELGTLFDLGRIGGEAS